MHTFTLPIDKAAFEISPDMKLIIELEDELGSLPDFYARLLNNRWKLCELVSFYHIALSQHHATPDYLQLGDRLLSSDIHTYQQQALTLLGNIFSGVKP